MRPFSVFIYHGRHVTGGAKGAVVDEVWEKLCYTIFRCVDGTMEVVRENRRWSFGPGRVGLTEPGCSIALSPRTQGYVLIFDPLWRERNSSGKDFKWKVRKPMPSWRELFEREFDPTVPEAQCPQASRMLGDIASRYWIGPMERVEANARLQLWLVRHLRGSPANRGEGDTGFAARVDRFIQRRLRDGVRIEDIAETLGVSVSTAASRYQAVRGMPLGEAIKRAQLDAAMRALETTNTPVNRIAVCTGYRNVSAFTRAFRRATGYTPTQWRERGRLSEFG